MGFRYFEELNYTLANEDARLETGVLPFGLKKVVAVGGSGARVLPLLTKNPKELLVVDFSGVQLAICELRVETLRRFNHEEFLRFWYPVMIGGETPEHRAWRKEIFDSLPLSREARQRLSPHFLAHRFSAITLTGKWERTFITFSKISKMILGRKNIEKLFSFDTLEEQLIFIEKGFPKRRFRFLIALVGNAKVFNALLYRGRLPRNNMEMSYVEYYEKAYLRLFQNGLASENFFLQLSLLGEIRNREALPYEANSEIFETAKQALRNTEVRYLKEDLIQVLEAETGVGFISFSNVPAYWGGELEQTFLKRIRGSLVPGGLCVLRHYLHYPEKLDRGGYEVVTNEFRDLIDQEKVQMYDPEILMRRES